MKKIIVNVSSCDSCPYAHRSTVIKKEYQCLIALGSHKSMICYSPPKDVTNHVLDGTTPKWCKLEDCKNG